MFPEGLFLHAHTHTPKLLQDNLEVIPDMWVWHLLPLSSCYLFIYFPWLVAQPLPFLHNKEATCSHSTHFICQR